MEKAKKETLPWVRKRRNNLTTTSGEKVVDYLAGKWKSGGTIAKISENNGNRGKKRSKKKRAEIS